MYKIEITLADEMHFETYLKMLHIDKSKLKMPVEFDWDAELL
jgi:hypothetical protein